MKKLFAAMTAALLMVSLAASMTFAAQPAAPGQNKLTCFGEPTACTSSNGKTATLNTNNGGAGVYLTGYNNSFYNVLLSQVTKLSNVVSGTLTPIDPRWSIPIDENNDGATEAFAFVAFYDCNNGAGLVDVINDATCTVNYGSSSYPNWSTFAHGVGTNFRISNGDYAFIIADLSGAPGVWTISNVTVGKPGK